MLPRTDSAWLLRLGGAFTLLIALTACTSSRPQPLDMQAIGKCEQEVAAKEPVGDRRTVSPAGTERWRVRLWSKTAEKASPVGGPDYQCFVVRSDGKLRVSELTRLRSPNPDPQPSAVHVVLIPPRRIVQISGTPFDQQQVDLDVTTAKAGKDLRSTGGGAVYTTALVFPAFTSPAACLQRVLVRIQNAAPLQGPLAIYPSAALSLARGQLPPEASGGASTLLDNRPRADGEAEADRSVAFDVTELARLWADGGPFPSQDRTVPLGTPLVLALRAPDLVEGSYAVTFAKAEVMLEVTPSSTC